MPSLSRSLKTTRSRLQETSEAGCGATVRSDRKTLQITGGPAAALFNFLLDRNVCDIFSSVCIGTAKQKKPSEARKHTKIQVNSESYSKFTSLRLWTPL